jgi:hypothetical protein
MDSLDRFSRLASRARAELPPPIEVTDRVLRAIRCAPAASPAEAHLLLFAGLSVAAAVAIAACAIGALGPMCDPMSGFFSAMSMVMQ